MKTFTAKQVCEILNIHSNTLYKLVKDKQLKPIVLGRSFRFLEEEVIRFSKERMRIK